MSAIADNPDAVGSSERALRRPDGTDSRVDRDQSLGTLDVRPSKAPPGLPSGSSKPRLGVGFVVWILMLTALAAGLRLHRLADWSLWEDELYSVRSVLEERTGMWSKQLGYAPIWAGLIANGVDLKPLVITAEMQDEFAARDRTLLVDTPAHAWRDAGINEWSIRIGPCLVGIAMVPLLGFVAQRAIGTGPAAWLALFLTFSPWTIFWSQSGRFYILQAAVAGLSVLWFYGGMYRADGTRGGSMRSFCLSMVALVIAFLSQPPSLVVASGFFVFWLLVRRGPDGLKLDWRHWVIGGAAVTLCLAIYGWDVMRSPESVAYHASLQGHGPLKMALGLTFRHGPVVALFAGMTALGLMASRQRPLVILMLATAVMPLVCIGGLAMAGMYTHTRYLFMTILPVLALVAIGADALVVMARTHLGGWRGTLLGGAGGGAVLGSMLVADLSYFTHGHAERQRWREAFAWLQTHVGDEPISSERRMIAEYYLGRDDIIPWPNSADALTKMEQPVWLVAPMASSREDLRFPYVHEVADMKAYWDLRILQPFSSIRVYRYDPNGVVE